MKAVPAKVRSRRPRLPAFVAPCLARAAEAPPEGDGWAHEIKFDGYRLQIAVAGTEVRIYTRSGLDWTGRFPHLADAARKLGPKSALIDGEAVVLDAKGVSRFTALVDALAAENDGAIMFMAFDLIERDGADLRARKLLERKQTLAELLRGAGKDSRLRFSDHMIGNGARMFAEASRLRVEGIVSKRLDKPYRSGRQGDWLKIKCVMTDEFVIAGYVDSTAMDEAVGSLVLGAYEGGKLVYCGRVGTGFTAETARVLWRGLQALRRRDKPFAGALTRVQVAGVTWVEPKLVAQVGYRAITGDGILRHASFEGLREDKPARQVRRAPQRD